MMTRYLLSVSLGIVIFISMLSPSFAETKKKKVAPQQQAAAKLAIPDPRRLNLLIRSTIVAVNHANITGNYSVLRDLSAPAFQQVNNPARLAELFAGLRKRNLDLAPTLLFDPKLIRPPAIQKNGLLRLSGFFDTRPERVVFDFQFQRIGATWRLFGLSVNTSVVEKSTASQATPEKQKAGTKPKTAKPAVKKKR